MTEQKYGIGYLGVVIQVAFGLLNALLLFAPTHQIVRWLNIAAMLVCFGLAVPTFLNVRSSRRMEDELRSMQATRV